MMNDNVYLNNYLNWLKKCDYCNTESYEYYFYIGDIYNVVDRLFKYYKIDYEDMYAYINRVTYFLIDLYSYYYLKTVKEDIFVLKEEVHSIGYKALVFMKEDEWTKIKNNIDCFNLLRRCLSHDFINLSVVKDMLERLQKSIDIDRRFKYGHK